MGIPLFQCRRLQQLILRRQELHFSKVLKDPVCPIGEWHWLGVSPGPDPKKSEKELRALRNQDPKLDEKHFKDIFPEDDQSTICVVQKSHARHYIHLQEAATWILNATHWFFNTLQHPMMIVIWCRDWEDASKLQYLMQILQVNLQDYIPRWQIFVERPETVQKDVVLWQSPSTIWCGHPVLGFMADTYLGDLKIVGFKHFNQMWSFPSTSVYQNRDPITFGMPAWHIKDDCSKRYCSAEQQECSSSSTCLCWIGI